MFFNNPSDQYLSLQTANLVSVSNNDYYDFINIPILVFTHDFYN